MSMRNPERTQWFGTIRDGKGARVRARSDIFRTQGGRGGRSVKISSGSEGELVSDGSLGLGIGVVFDEPDGNYIQWTGPYAVEDFERDVEILARRSSNPDSDRYQAMARRLARGEF